MNNMPLRLLVALRMRQMDLMNRAKEMAQDDRGEIGSWMILAAALAAAAGIVAGLLGPWIEAKATDITSQ